MPGSGVGTLVYGFLCFTKNSAISLGSEPRIQSHARDLSGDGLFGHLVSCLDKASRLQRLQFLNSGS